MLSLAGQRPPAGGAWLWVTVADARRGGEFTALFLPRTRPRANGGDVLLRIAPGTSQAEEHWPGPAARVQVQAVVAGSLIHVAGWDHLSLDLWPEAVRATAAFAMGALKELQEHGADVGARDQVDVETAAEPGRPGSPACRMGEGRRRGMIPGVPLARGRAPDGARPLPRGGGHTARPGGAARTRP